MIELLVNFTYYTCVKKKIQIFGGRQHLEDAVLAGEMEYEWKVLLILLPAIRDQDSLTLRILEILNKYLFRIQNYRTIA